MFPTKDDDCQVVRPGLGQGKAVIGGAQFPGMAGEKERNADAAERGIREAAALGAQIVLTPEVGLTGFVGGDKERELAEEIPGPATERFGDLARELGVYILLGMSESLDGEILNAMPVISPQGEVIDVFRKVHINKYEATGGWRNGSRFPVWEFKTPAGQFRGGIMICYDREVPESARILMLKGADVIFNPLACGCPTNDIHRCLLRTRAFENELYLFMVNNAAPRMNGHSMVFDYNGDIVREMGEEECAFAHELDFDALNVHRCETKEAGIYGFHHRRPELYGILCDPEGQMHPDCANLPPG